MLPDPHGTPTFITEGLCLVSDVQFLNCHLLLNERQILHCLLWLEFMMHFITKATPINNNDSRCHIKKPESSIAYITGYSGFISCELFLLAWEADTHTYRCPYKRNFKKPGALACGWHAPGFKNMLRQIIQRSDFDHTFM